MNERGISGVGSTSRARAGMRKGGSIIDSEGLLGRKVLRVWVRLASFRLRPCGAVLPQKLVFLPLLPLFLPNDDPGVGCKGVRSCRREGLKLAFSFL